MFNVQCLRFEVFKLETWNAEKQQIFPCFFTHFSGGSL